MFTNHEKSLHGDPEMLLGKKLKCTLPTSPLQQCCQSHPLEKVWDRLPVQLKSYDRHLMGWTLQVFLQKNLLSFPAVESFGFVHLYGFGRCRFKKTLGNTCWSLASWWAVPLKCSWVRSAVLQEVQQHVHLLLSARFCCWNIDHNLKTSFPNECP